MLDELFSGLDPNSVDTFLTDDQDAASTTPADTSPMASLQSTAPLSLGDLDFSGFSKPRDVQYGTKQRYTLHKFPGGARFVDALGSDYSDVSWNGIYIGGDREGDISKLRAMVDAGDVVELAWGALNLDVLPVQADFRDHDGYTDYTITCVVLSFSSVTADDPSAYSSVSDDVQAAQDIAPLSAANVDLTTLTSTLRTISTSPQSLTNPLITGLLSSASGTLASEVSQASAAIRLVPQIAGTDRSTAQTITDIQTTMAALTAMSTSNVGVAYLNRSLATIKGLL